MRHICCWLIALPLMAQALSTSPEEAAVRTTYAKLAYAVQLNTLHGLTTNKPEVDRGELAKEMAANELRFQISNFRSGNIWEISKVNYGDLVSEPSGEEALHVGPVRLNVRDDTGPEISTETAVARWDKGQTVMEDWNIPMEKMLLVIEEQNNSRYSRYAAYTITASFRGRSRTYKALFLFGQNQQGPVVHPVDTVLGINGGSLHYFLAHPVYPSIFLHTTLRDKQAVREFLVASPVESCQSARGDACCDLATLKCSAHSEDLLEMHKGAIQ